MSATPADVLNRAAELIERDGWCQHDYYVDGKRCADGAIACVGGSHDWMTRSEARRIVETITGVGLIDWNDAPERTKDEVVRVLRAAAERAA